MRRLARALRRRLGALRRRLGRRRLPGLASGADPATQELVDAAMAEYAREHPDDYYVEGALTYDKVRFARSLAWLAKLDLADKRVLELGGYGIASHVIRRRFPDHEHVNTDFDLREPFPHPAASFDVVIAMEVVEHICDRQYQHATTLSGVRQCLAECRRVLRPDGRLFLTTPNAAAVWIVQRALLREPPWHYEWHFREFTPAELRSLLEETGFRVLESGTEQVWHFWNFDPILAFMREQGYSLDDRGDDIFLVAAPAAAPP